MDKSDNVLLLPVLAKKHCQFYNYMKTTINQFFNKNNFLMKSFTKFYVLMLALLVSVGMTAQVNENAEQFEQQKLEAQRWLDMHGPTVEVPAPSSREVAATGDDCSDPIVVDLGALPFSDMGNTTCGRGDDYDATCMGVYDGGEDAHYELQVPGPMWIQVTFDPVDTWSGIAIKDACGNSGTCLVLKTGSSNAERIFKYEFTTAGTYYIQVDTWPSPNCTG